MTKTEPESKTDSKNQNTGTRRMTKTEPESKTDSLRTTRITKTEPESKTDSLRTTRITKTKPENKTDSNNPQDSSKNQTSRERQPCIQQPVENTWLKAKHDYVIITMVIKPPRAVASQPCKPEVNLFARVVGVVIT